MGDLDGALEQLDATEANLQKLKKIWKQIHNQIPQGLQFGETKEYDDCCRAFRNILDSMPSIEGSSMPDKLYSLSAIGGMRLDAKESMDGLCEIGVEEAIVEQGRELEDYEYRLSKMRRKIIRKAVKDAVARIDALLIPLNDKLDMDNRGAPAPQELWEDLKSAFLQLTVLLGSSRRRGRWGDMERHLAWGEMGDVHDVLKLDWPTIRPAINEMLVGGDDPIPVQVSDLAELTSHQLSGHVSTKLAWQKLDAEEFERLVFSLVDTAEGYENAMWLTNVNAPDSGRDVSVDKIVEDSLGYSQRLRVIIQCKHLQSSSVSVNELTTLIGQMTAWEPPRVDILVIATSSMLTKDAVSYIEKHNSGDKALRIVPWVRSHLEKLLAKKPALLAEFQLRQ